MTTKCGETITTLQEESILEYTTYFQNLKKEMIFNKSRSWKKYYDQLYLFHPPCTYSYSITSHKSQGSTIDICFVDLRDIFYTLVNIKPQSIEKTMYTAISRASHKLYCYF